MRRLHAFLPPSCPPHIYDLYSYSQPPARPVARATFRLCYGTRLLPFLSNLAFFLDFVMSRVPANVFECSVAEFLKNRADAAPDEADALQAVLAGKGITSPKKLANLTLDQLGLPADTPAGHIATMVEGLEQAAGWRRALRLSEESAQACNGLATSAAPSGRQPIASRAIPRRTCAVRGRGWEA